MQLEFKSTPLTYLNSRLRQALNQEQTLELRLPEGMPDLGRILMTGGQARLSAKQWRSDSVSISGGIQAWAIYLPEDGSEPRLVEGWIPFQGKWNLPEGCREGILDARITLRNMDGRVLSPRKMLLRASVALCAEALCPEEVAVHSPEEVPGGIHLLQNTYPVRLCREAGEKVFSLEDTLYGDTALPEKLFCCRLIPRLTEQGVTGDRLVLRGKVDVWYLGCDGEGAFRTGHLELPISQLAQLDGEYDKEATCGVCLSLAACDWQPEGDGLHLRCEVVAQYRVYGNCVMQIAQDAYSPTVTLEPWLQMLQLPVMLDACRERMEVSQVLQLPADRVLEVAFWEDEPVTYREGDSLVAELPGLFQLLYIDDDGHIQSMTESWCGRWALPAGEGCSLRLRSCSDGAEAAVQNGQVRLQAGLWLEAETYGAQSIPMLTGLTLGQSKEPDPDRPTVILRRAGENSLWDLAKGHGSTVDAIKQANKLAGEPDPMQMLLIPVL